MTQLAPDVSATVTPAIRGNHVHSVQFYETDGFLAEQVAAFIAEGFRLGDAAILITTRPHRELITARLRAKGIDVERELSARRLSWLDAAETLTLFMEGDSPVVVLGPRGSADAHSASGRRAGTSARSARWSICSGAVGSGSGRFASRSCGTSWAVGRTSRSSART